MVCLFRTLEYINSYQFIVRLNIIPVQNIVNDQLELVRAVFRFKYKKYFLSCNQLWYADVFDLESVEMKLNARHLYEQLDYLNGNPRTTDSGHTVAKDP